jgi:ferredoxin
MHDPTTAADASLPATSRDGEARAAALAQLATRTVTPTSLVAYRSAGRLLVVGPAAPARAAAACLERSPLRITLLITDDAPTAAAGDAAGRQVREIHAPVAAVRGHLGAFEVDVLADGVPRPLAPSVLTGNLPFDLVLDLEPRASIDAPVAPPGYYRPGADDAALAVALAQLPEMEGEFEKPRYFNYAADICAHGARGIAGCRRCLDACPTLAISSQGERIQVDPYLCQGGGSCATACPTGAISYAYPTAADQVEAMRGMLRAYHDAGGARPMLLFHDAEAGAGWIREHRDTLPQRMLPVLVEEVGSVGMELWLSALAFGATAVAMLVHADTPQPVRAELDAQAGVANEVLLALGLVAAGGAAVRLVEAPADASELEELDAGVEAVTPAAFAGVAGKREQLMLALDHLHASSLTPPDAVALSPPSPFGAIEVKREACTLCFGCASVCPGSAVMAGGDRPQLLFVEANCVQCGLCESACPEDAISLVPRLLFRREARTARRVLMEDVPFPCVCCGKVFGTRRTIDRVVEKLAGHWMYQDKPEQLERLKMCEECRVKDMFRGGGGLLDPEPPARH